MLAAGPKREATVPDPTAKGGVEESGWKKKIRVVPKAGCRWGTQTNRGK